MPELRITDESGARVFPWNGEEVFCGRNPDNTLVLAEKKASRKHCRFFREGAFYRVEDLKSSNGTVVAGARVTVHTLAPGDTVQIGASTIQFVDTAPAAPPP
ncbi:MAG: FHA domain-containing protein, partial [Planctomycetes bacterium]|nr:FHA domain-containing protein [Planctomycetota bacterium]